MTLSTLNPFTLGINYWPARTAMGWWRSFDRTEVETDFARIAAGGFDSVRLFLTWEDFQPSPTRVNPICVGRLLTALDAASDAGLAVIPTLFTGHMSGVNWIPPWALGDASGDDRFRVVASRHVVQSRLASWYCDETITRAQALLASELAKALAGHAALWAWDLGNENSNCGSAPDRPSARDWLRRITGAIRTSDVRAKVTIGLHMEDLEHDRNLGPREAAEVCDFLTMHGYPGYASFTSGPTDERLLPFLCRLTARLSGDADVLFSEFGVPTEQEHAPGQQQADSGPALVGEREAAAYISRSLAALHQCGSTGAMLWCYSDYSTDRFDEPPFDLAVHERSFGQWRADGSAKPSVASALSFAGHREALPPAAPLAHSSWFDMNVEDYYLAPERNLRRLFERYCSAADQAGRTS